MWCKVTSLEKSSCTFTLDLSYLLYLQRNDILWHRDRRVIRGELITFINSDWLIRFKLLLIEPKIMLRTILLFTLNSVINGEWLMHSSKSSSLKYNVQISITHAPVPKMNSVWLNLPFWCNLSFLYKQWTEWNQYSGFKSWQLFIFLCIHSSLIIRNHSLNAVSSYKCLEFKAVINVS